MTLPKKLPAGPEWLDGPAFVAWLEDHWALQGSLYPEGIQRRIWQWRHGSPASIWVADKLLTAMGLHLDIVPEEMFMAESPQSRREGRRGKFTDAELAEAVELVVVRKWSYGDVCGQTGIGRTRLGEAVRAARRGAAA